MYQVTKFKSTIIGETGCWKKHLTIIACNHKTHIRHQTADGHCDLETESDQWAGSAKMLLIRLNMLLFYFDSFPFNAAATAAEQLPMPIPTLLL